MVTVNNEIDKVVDILYDARKAIRGIYNKATQADIMSLEENIKSIVVDQFKNKSNTTVNVQNLFSINIELQDAELVPEKKKCAILVPVDRAIRSFILSHTEDKQIISYVNNLNNMIMDYYSVGNSIKFIL